MIDSMHVLDVLQQRGYMPVDLVAGEQWFDGPGGKVRVVLDEEGGSVIYMFTGHALNWSATLTPDTPGAVFLAALDAAEQIAKGGQPRMCSLCGIRLTMRCPACSEVMACRECGTCDNCDDWFETREEG